MKPHKFLGLVLVCALAFSCKKDDNVNPDNPNLGADADYSLLVKNTDGFEVLLLDADIDKLVLDSATSSFPMTALPDLSYKDGSVFSFYQKTGDCGGTFLKFDFSDETSKETALFSDLGVCNLTTYAVAHNGNIGYVAYGLDIGGGATGFYVRAFNLDGPADDFVDIDLSKQPVHLSFANNRLFVLTRDVVANENYVTVINAETNAVLIEMDAAIDAKKLLRNTDDTIIISHNALHTLLNSSTLDPQYVQYQVGLEPAFVNSSVNNFGDQNLMYYERPSGVHSEYPSIPAAYNFVTNLTTLYPFEAYLTQQEREFEYEIETTTMVGYDKKNGYMLIGYKKVGIDKGGILRVRTGDNPAVIDNININGIPVNIVAE